MIILHARQVLFAEERATREMSLSLFAQQIFVRTMEQRNNDERSRFAINFFTLLFYIDFISSTFSHEIS